MAINEDKSNTVDAALELAGDITQTAISKEKKETTALPDTLTATTATTPVTTTVTPEAVTQTETTTPVTETTQTTQIQGDQSQTTAVATPTTAVGAETTAVATTTPESEVSATMSQELYNSSDNFDTYVKAQGYTIQTIDGKVYVNNSVVDWQSLGLSMVDGVLTGTKAQFDQILKNVKDSGYTTGQTFAEFAKDNGYSVTRSSDGSYIILNGIPIDPTLYSSMTKLNNNWVGTAEIYQQMISDSLMPTKADPDYVNSTEFADYARKKGYTVSTDKNNYSLVINGYTAMTEYYPGLKLENGKVVGDEATYRQIIADSLVYEKVDLQEYYGSNGIQISHNADGYLLVRRNNSETWKAIHAPYWQNAGIGELRLVNGKWIASKEVYDAMLSEAFARSDYDIDTYAKTLGYVTGRDAAGNLTVNGKSIAGTNKTGNFDAAVATYYNDLILVDGKYVASEETYRKIFTDLQNRSDKSFADYGQTADSAVTVLNGKVYINGTLTDLTGTSIQVINGQAYGTEADYKTLIDKANAGYTYTSPYETQIQAALQEIQDFEVYQTPQETLDQINTLMNSAKEKFNYDPNADSALKTAQAEAERVVRESAGVKGMLYSSGTISTAAKKAGELIPTYEQQAYSRWADQKTREMSLLQTIMDWDEMQNDRNVDQLNLVKTKFDTIMSMDSKSIEEFKVLLDQKNADKQYALDQESAYIEQQQQEIDLAWKRVESLGYVDSAASIVLGVPVGTKASWAQQAALEHQYALEELAKNNDYQRQLQNSQAAIERSLTEYKASLDEATQLRLLAQQYGNEKSLAQQSYQNQLYLARTYK